MKTNKKVPFPQIVSGDSNWKVFQDSERPRTSNLSKEMYVPFGDACDDVVTIMTKIFVDMSWHM